MKKVIVITGIILVVVLVMGLANQYRTNATAAAQKPQLPPPLATSQQDRLRYTDYSPVLFHSLSDQRRVLFFKANWCATCTGADQELSQQTSQLPADITVFKVNFDRETQLRTKYGVTTQHTFVQVDSQGQLVKIWNGGGVEQLLKEVSY